ncbi:MAG TPA: M20/M25/M40 family metallo-hydrolase [Longimicrobiales bacterium]|nr:M20/M25/M40 family metallo-hydrolase [Longimicrobiales bacterium]
MRAPRIFPVLLGLALLLSAAAPAAAPASVREAMESIREPAIRAHLAFLADDLLEGRATGSRGGAIAARYIAAQLAASGVEPIGDSYYQTVPLNGWRARPQRTHLDFTAGQRTLALQYGDDAVIWTAGGADSASVTGEVVFIGYGVTAPEYDWDDFKGRDLTGRIAVVLVPDPPAPPQHDIFDGRAMSFYGRWTYKVEEAARRGAAAVLVVHTPDGAGYSWGVVRSSFTGEQLSLRGGTQPPRPVLQGWVSLDAARRMFALGNHNLSELYVRAARRDFQPLFTGITASIRTTGTVRRLQSANVVGMVTGRHPTRRNDAVIYTAHYDGLGIGAPANGDSIYNGAYDNASGVAALLEIARAFASLDTPPDRSVVFLFPTAEEAGLLGSTWYTQQPLVPMQRTVAALNLDGVNIWGETEDVGGVGLERSTLGVAFERQAAVLGLRVTGERAPEKGFFFRSDHFPFARAGVPALFIDHGVTFRNRPPDWGINILSRFEADRYHLPGDRYEPGIDLAGAVQQARLAFLVGHDVASAAERPRWYPGATIPRP